ncbi:hypothetical protein CAOG_06444 [Capsaspora owczarzaki ATCC 30864]|uniref:Uncharacterized protein n=1 Tax=Capsaspora owczarzaki (strain ATCC 30864) TaxID=595528 RepID=A0A0D2VWV7_CAPO3|nr:hypothetical protein CAOG_06444 [Capsaspora owczarzaki ATCC 30864]KJE96071.1 hypothetical protein CAOG_006444 [Capsaspora owczarzaki ATCC 30864]KJE96072.1 hypothetical protein, variant [Capsaspora owczarzaki ATCC 30864]|eukprot:XP_004345193.2 hypothetical protein CAOG_06444 [Capsaspora owczarzaki ATCC 30864]
MMTNSDSCGELVAVPSPPPPSALASGVALSNALVSSLPSLAEATPAASTPTATTTSEETTDTNQAVSASLPAHSPGPGADEETGPVVSIASMMNEYESRIAREVLKWERDTLHEVHQSHKSKKKLEQAVAATPPRTATPTPSPAPATTADADSAKAAQPGAATSWWDWLTGSSAISQMTTNAIYDCLVRIESLALDTVSLDALQHNMMTFAARSGLAESIHSPAEFDLFTLQQLDELAATYASPSYLASFIQGAGLGLGGLLFMTADIPLLIALNCRVLAQLGYIYGGQYYAKPAVVLHLFVSSCSSMLAEAQDDAVRAHSAAHDLVSEWQRRVSLETLRKDVITDVEKGVVTEVIKNISIFLAAHFAKSKLLQLIPVVGGAVGAGSNYFFTATCVRNAQMTLRRQYLDRRFGMAAVHACLDAQDDEAFAWTLVDHAEDDGDFDEFAKSPSPDEFVSTTSGQGLLVHDVAIEQTEDEEAARIALSLSMQRVSDLEHHPLMGVPALSELPAHSARTHKGGSTSSGLSASYLSATQSSSSTSTGTSTASTPSSSRPPMTGDEHPLTFSFSGVSEENWKSFNDEIDHGEVNQAAAARIDAALTEQLM